MQNTNTQRICGTISGKAGKDDHHLTSDLIETFQDPDQYYDLWVYGFVWMHVYFQVGMIIGDTEQHNKQYIWLLWRKWLT